MRKMTKQLTLLCTGFALWLTFCASFTLRAGDCVSDCMRFCWSGGSVSDPAYCRDQLNRCEIACQSKKSYGAIAYSAKDKVYGFSHGWNNQSKAEKVALDNCSQRGSECKAIVWYYNGCGAVAADGNIVTWGRDSAKQKAEQSALDECTRAGGHKCAVKTSQCSR
jgi:hypothetical protein